jgi:glycosyltransferase involved in cell wall biosynthesis
MPEVSVVIPTRSRSRMLAVALRSALWQRDVNMEVIVVDDGSTDDTEAMVRAVSDSRVHLIREEVPGGVSAARNRGIGAAVGEWVAFLDDDDVWAPDKVVRQLDAAATAGRDWVYAGDVNVDSNLHILDGGPPPPPDEVVASLQRFNAVPSGASNVVVRADLLAAVGNFDPQLTTNEDWDMWIRLAGYGPPAWVCSPLVAYRLHSGNAALDPTPMITEPEIIATRYGLNLDRAGSYRRAAWACLRRGRRLAALRYYGHAVALGDIRSAARALMALVHPAAGSGDPFQLQRARSDGDEWAAEVAEWLEKIVFHSVRDSGDRLT